jgi:L-alanine-DL-glutamate epimerase-like enolase superfamily enzyme
MRIIETTAWLEDMQLTRPYAIAGELCTDAYNVFVSLRTDTGLIGLGAGSPSPRVTGETLEAANAILGGVADTLIGRDPADRDVLCAGLDEAMPATPAARAALDIAIHDLHAKAQGKSLVDCFGRVHRALPTSITIGIQSLEESLEEAAEYVARGFRIIKLKIGDDVEADIETSARLCELMGERMGEQAGDGITLRVDGNQGYDGDDLERYLAGTHALKLEFIEQPLPRGRLSEMRTLPADVRRVCAADEDLHSPADARALIEAPQAFGIFNIKLMKSGGIFPAMQIAALADTAGIELMWGCMDESRISIAAALHAALACPATRYLDLDGSLDLARDIVSGGFRLRDGCLDVCDGPGLGVTRIGVEQ